MAMTLVARQVDFVNGNIKKKKKSKLDKNSLLTFEKFKIFLKNGQGKIINNQSQPVFLGVSMC